MASKTDSVSGDYTVIGTRPVRHDGVDKVTGHALYGADFSLAGQLYGKVLRSPHAHARILSIDLSNVLKHPEAKAVVTFEDFADSPRPARAYAQGAPVTENILARDKVFYKGHPVVAIAATSPHVAEQLLGLIDVEYEVLPAVFRPQEAISPEAPILHDHWANEAMPDGTEGMGANVAAHEVYQQGNVEKGFETAAHVVEREFNTKSVHQGYIEPQNATAYWTPEGRLTLWCSSQGHFAVRDNTAEILGIPISDIKVVPMEIGGGFGGKIPPYLEPLAAVLSKKSGLPVKMYMDRTEVIQATGPTSGSHVKVKIGVSSNGNIEAATANFIFESGAYPGAPLAGAAAAVFAPYAIDNVRIDGFDVVDNKPKTQAYRAPGAPIVAFAVESVLDDVASDLNMDPMDLRILNSAHEGQRRADGVINLRIGAEETMTAVKNHAHYNSPLGDASPGKKRGRGVGMGFCRNNTGMACAIANVLPDGKVSLIEGSVDIGGSRTAIAQQFAEVLGIDVTEVHPYVGDTDAVGYTSVTGGSGVTFKSGWAAYTAAMDVKTQMIERAALLWDCSIDQVDYKNGRVFHISDPELSLSFKEVAGKMPETGGPIVGSANMNPGGSGGSYSANIIDVEVDMETGKIDILRVTAFQDAGTAIHPDYVEGQMQGGTVQGIGWALNEEFFMGSDGAILNTSLLDYRMPTSLDLPMIDPVIVEVPNPGHPFGVRGVGEANLSAPLAAVSNAAFRATGIRILDLPMSPDSVHSAIDKTS
tara:strand:+ start:22 stop:2298 length:2277 start_codon:yes stop_codon:yes gene_type:complete